VAEEGGITVVGGRRGEWREWMREERGDEMRWMGRGEE
jgi:hypothetical protein